MDHQGVASAADLVVLCSSRAAFRIDIHGGDAQADHDVGPTRPREQGRDAGGYDRDIGQGVVAGGQERSLGQTARMATERTSVKAQNGLAISAPAADCMIRYGQGRLLVENQWRGLNPIPQDCVRLPMASDIPDGPAVQKMRLDCGIDLAFRTAGDETHPALVLLHGFPSSSRTFREVIGPLSRIVHVVAPDLPGFGASDVLSAPSFSAFADRVEDLLERLGVRERFIYLHDYGAPVGLQLAMRAPDLVSGLVIQNANAHPSGLGPEWAQTMEFWAAPNAENEAAATAHLTLDGVRRQYTGGLPEEIAARIDPESWIEDWRVMSLPSRMETQRALIVDYANHVARFDEIAAYLATHQPPALLLWGRHDPFFALAEVSSWLAALPRMEAHIFDAGHFLLETHAVQAARLMSEFLDLGRQGHAPGPDFI